MVAENFSVRKRPEIFNFGRCTGRGALDMNITSGVLLKFTHVCDIQYYCSMLIINQQYDLAVIALPYTRNICSALSKRLGI